MTLERRYRRLLRAYPRSYRARRAEEMLGTLLESAPPGQTRPTRREAADLMAGALRERLGLHALPRFEAGLRIAGPIGLVVATAAAAGDWAAGARGIGSTVVAAAWLLALLAREAAPRLNASPVLAWLVTLGVLGMELVGYQPGLVRQLLVPASFGLVAALGCTVTRPQPSTMERFAAPAVVCVLVAGSALVGRFPRIPSWLELVWLVPIAVLAVGALRPSERRNTTWAWAAAVLLVPIPNTRQSIPPIASFGHGAGAVATPILATLLALVVYLAYRQRTAAPADHGAKPLAAVGSFSLGAAAGICVAAVGLGVGGLFAGRVLGGAARGDLLALALPVVAAVVATFGRLRLPAVGVALAGLAVLLAAGRVTTVQLSLVAVVALLLVVAVAAGPETAPGRVLIGALVAGGLTTLSGFVGSPELFRLPVVRLDVWPRYAVGVQETAVPLLAGVILIPALLWAVFVIVRSGLRPGPVVTVAASLVWLVWMIRPVVLLDPRLLAGIAIGAVVALVIRRPRVATTSASTDHTVVKGQD